jgi:hypothetical protein
VQQECFVHRLELHLVVVHHVLLHDVTHDFASPIALFDLLNLRLSEIFEIRISELLLKAKRSRLLF